MNPQLLSATEVAALQLFKSVTLRFLKGAVAGMVSALIKVTIAVPQTWSALSTALVALAYAALIGFFTGGFLALEKYYNWDLTPPVA